VDRAVSAVGGMHSHISHSTILEIDKAHAVFVSKSPFYRRLTVALSWNCADYASTECGRLSGTLAR